MHKAILLLLFPLMAFAYSSVIAKPENAASVLPLYDVSAPQEFFGVLSDHPHTFEFAVQEASDFKAVVLVHDAAYQVNDASIILVKEERRGVSEIGRTKGKNEQWETIKDTLLVESFRRGGEIASVLEPGVYRLEVSSPNNDAQYRLVLGTEAVSRGYAENVRALFEVKQLYGSSRWSVFLSPLLYIPLLVLLLCAIAFLVYRKLR